MKIRPADLDTDAGAILAGAQDFIARMDYRAFLPTTDEGLGAALARVLGLECVEVLVAETDRIVGGIGMLYAPHVWNPDAMHAEELFWWTDRGAPSATALRLVRSARERAREKGARFMTFKALTSSPGAVQKVYARMGLQQIETAYMGAV